VTAINGFNSQVSVTVSGMPTGATATPSQFNLSPGGQQAVVIAASLTAAVATSALTVTGTSGTLQHSNQIAFKVSALQGPPPAIATATPAAAPANANSATNQPSTEKVNTPLPETSPTPAPTESIDTIGLPAGFPLPSSG